MKTAETTLKKSAACRPVLSTAKSVAFYPRSYPYRPVLFAGHLPVICPGLFLGGDVQQPAFVWHSAHLTDSIPLRFIEVLRERVELTHLLAATAANSHS